MKIKQKLAEVLFGDVIENKLREAVNPYVGGIDADDWMFKKLTGKANKDLSPLTQQRALKIAYYLYETNPLAHRILETTKDMVVGEGITYQAEDERVKALLDEFWYDPDNHWDLKQHQKALELGMYGEQCYPAFVNEVNGRVKLGYIDPLNIADVITDDDNAERALGIKMSSSLGNDPKIWGVIGMDEISGRLNSPQNVGNTPVIGGCFFFAVNKVSNATRGRSDLLCLADWIDAYDKLLFNRLDRAALLNAFVWDVTIEGADKKTIDEFLRADPPPKPGSRRVHNERVKWEAVSPDLKSADAQIDAQLIKNHIATGAGQPPHWLSEGGDVNRATAAEMGDPAIKKMMARQRYFRYMIEYIFQFVIDQAIIHKRLPKGINENFSVIMPEISTKDTMKLSSSLQQVTTSLAVAQDKNWISEESARNIFASICKQVSGVDYNPADEPEKIAAEAQKTAADIYNRQPPPKV